MVELFRKQRVNFDDSFLIKPKTSCQLPLHHSDFKDSWQKYEHIACFVFLFYFAQ